MAINCTKMQRTIFILALWACSSSANGRATEPHNVGIFSLSAPSNEDNALDITIRDSLQVIRAVGKLGLSHPGAVGNWAYCNQEESCIQWGDFAKVEIKNGSAPGCGRIEWASSYANELEDCYDLQQNVHWYGGGETHTQTWPIQKNPRQLSAYVTGDFLQSHEYFYGGVAERYWLLSNGAALTIDPDTPLFFAMNTTRLNKVCFVAKKNELPYEPRDVLTMNYEWCLGSNIKEAHQLAMNTFFEKPTGIPDEVMMIRPFWSTWAEYKTEVNQTIVLDYARKVVSEGFEKSSHIEIDDHWETCYGEEKFNPAKFPDPKAMNDEIKAMGMKVTAWVHPFINYECELFNEGMRNGYFVQNKKPRVGISWWWQGTNAGVIDMTNPDAVAWWSARLKKLQEDTGLDSYKFDAGEVNWLPAAANLNNNTDRNLWPQLYTKKYVEACAAFGGLIETRATHLNQKLPAFIRMLDKDSVWGYDNGLKSMIPTLLNLGIVGYPFVLPDMIGGNAYDGLPSKEMYVRWMQINIFMPAVQFSIVPWKYDAETVQICLDVLAQREKYSDVILEAARQATVDGSPINRPIWWVDPEDVTTHTIDDAYMLGDKILVAAVVEEGATSRDIYLPQGTWKDQNGQTHTGKQWLRNYPAPLNVVPFFVKED